MARGLESITDEIASITAGVRAAEGKAEDFFEALGSLYGEDKSERWLQLQKRAAVLLADLRIAHNRRLKPLQAEYAAAWNRKWR